MTIRTPRTLDLLLDLTRRLAEEFDTVAIPMVTSTVRSAAKAVELFGNDVADSLDTIERIAREDLVALRDTAAEQADTALAG